MKRNSIALPVCLFCSLFAVLMFTDGGMRAQSPNTATLVINVVDQNGAVVPGAAITVQNSATRAVRNAVSDDNGVATVPALSLSGAYSITVGKTGFIAEDIKDLRLRAGESAVVTVKLNVGGGRSEVTVSGTAEGVQADPQTGQRFDGKQLDEAPILGRKVSSVPLMNSAFRQAKGTGDLFVNQTYYVTGVGGRRQTTVTLDGAGDDEAWGRQTAIATIPIAAIQEVTVLSNAFSAEYGWTTGSALNIVTRAGSNAFHGEGILMARPGSWQAKSFSTKGFCPGSVPTCVTPTTLKAISPVDIPDFLMQYSGAFGGPLVKDRTFFFFAADHTRQDRTAFLSSSLPSFVLPANGELAYKGHYRQTLTDGRIDHNINARQTLAFRVNTDRFFDDNPQDTVGGTSAPSVARRYSRRSWTLQGNYTAILNPNLINEMRVSYLNGDPITKWEALNLSTTYTRSGSVPFTIGQSRVADFFGHQMQVSDTLTWTKGINYFRFGGGIIRHTAGGSGSEFGAPILGTFTFKNTTTAPFDQLTLADVQNYSQPLDFGIDEYRLTQHLYTGFIQDSIRVRRDLTIDLGVRYDRQTITTAKANFAPRIGFAWNPAGDTRTVVRGGYGMYYTQVRSNTYAAYLINGLDGLTSYTAIPGQLGFPTCLTGSCLPLSFDPRTLPASQLPARDITIRAAARDYYRSQFARYGLNFDLLPDYPNEFNNPRSQIATIGFERELSKGLFAGASYLHQHLSGIDRTVDLNAPSVFDRTTAGQVRTVTAANATRPILPVNGGVRQVNVLTNLGVADYDGVQTQITYRGDSRLSASFGYTLSKATNTTEVDGNGVNPDQSNIDRLGESERGPSVLDQRHRAVLSILYRLPYNFTMGTLTQLASARPFNATTGVDNNGDGLNNDRPVINGVVVARSAYRGTGTQDMTVFGEERLRLSERTNLLLRVEVFNLFNHANLLGRGITTYGNTDTPNPTFGQFASAGTAANAIPAFANIDPPRMVQLQVRFIF